MKKLLKSKGFTLIELIVVITIIGILSAVLIPSVTGYIEKAKRSNDTQTASKMNQAIDLYCIENNIDKSQLTGIDIRTMLSFRNFSLKPSSSKWTYIYNINEQIIQVVNLSNGLIFSEVEEDPIDPTNIEVGMYLIGKGTSNIEKAVNMLSKYTVTTDFTTVSSMLSNSTHSSVINMFDPKTTLYIGNGGVINRNNVEDISKVVFIELTVHVPRVELVNLTLPAAVNQPKVLKTIEKESAFTSRFKGLKEVSDDNIGRITTINIPDTQSGIDLDEARKISVELGSYVTNSSIQEFYDEFVGYKYFDYNSNEYKIVKFEMTNEKDNGNLYYTIVRRFTVSYYNESGLYARGTHYYNIDVPIGF